MKNFDKYFTWFGVALIWGGGDVATTYYAVNILGLQEGNDILVMTGFHKTLVGYTLFKIILISFMVYFNEFAFNIIAEAGDYRKGAYHMLPIAFTIAGSWVVYTNIIVILHAM